MAWLLFVDESGYDGGESPCAVLGGVAVEDRELWNLVKAAGVAEERCFGRSYKGPERELKAKKLLTRKVFRLASQLSPIPPAERAFLARECLEQGGTAGMRQLTALAQAKLAYVSEVLELCALFRCKVFASVVARGTPIPNGVLLRKDYVYLFERFFYYLEDLGPAAFGIVVFDELEKTQCHHLAGQMDAYFKRSVRGRLRAGQILPEPLFVHSDLTTGVQLADLVAYVISWGARFPGMDGEGRPEIGPLIKRVMQLRHRTIREVKGNPAFVVWSLAWIRDLGPRQGSILTGETADEQE